MRLDEYLGLLKTCPDERLTEELGIYDGWSIFLCADPAIIIRHLTDSGRYELAGHRHLDGGLISKLNFILGTVEAQVFNWVPPHFCRGSETDKEMQLREYNMTVTLTYQDRLIEGVDGHRAIAIVVDDIGQLVIREGIPSCTPSSRGWAHLNDFSRIVYHKPDKPAAHQ